MDSEEANQLTLQGLAQRLETLERENAELRHKVATLEDSGTRRDELAEKRGSDTPRDGEPVTEEFAGRVSRRSLLSKAGAAALGAVAAGTLLNQREAKADHFGPAIEVDHLRAHSGGVVAVVAVSEGSYGVLGIGRSGVRGEASLEGIGGEFQGGRAQLRLAPSSSAGIPTTGLHERGELYMDSQATLYVCTAEGTPGTWRRVRTTAA